MLHIYLFVKILDFKFVTTDSQASKTFQWKVFISIAYATYDMLTCKCQEFPVFLLHIHYWRS